jgi:hypothetical protein
MSDGGAYFGGGHVGKVWGTIIVVLGVAFGAVCLAKGLVLGGLLLLVLSAVLLLLLLSRERIRAWSLRKQDRAEEI